MSTGLHSAAVHRPSRLRGTIAIPGDKSISHRALILNALARGRAHIDGFLDAADTRSTLACLRALGAHIEPASAGAVVVHGAGRASLHEPEDVLDCGNSGTTMRLLTGALAGLPMFAVLTGDASLRRRPMDRIVQPLRALGAELSGRADGRLPPLVVRGGALRGGQRIESRVASAQVKSSILLAALAADGPTTVVEPEQSRDHTERMLRAMGAGVTIDGGTVTLTPPAGDLRAVDVTVPGDISTAAPWIVAATLHPDAELLLTGVGVNPTRTGLLDILWSMGAAIELLEERESGGEPVADLLVRSAALHGVEVGGALVPRAIDELPLVALAGALASGETLIRDAAELRVKESDRVATTAEMLRAFGVTVEERPDGMRVRGGASLRGAAVGSSGDHRLAMLGAVAALLAEGETAIDDSGAVAVSYPDFWRELARLGGVQESLRG
ncbi:MAG: 3-phosphoshikimate 1-carboxyvinyltransferase [Dehalococcoidia bacterium]|nr:3-phosphoshikimate 1-carboxyvinyltransferase [Dehalococcoidia bacterium]